MVLGAVVLVGLGLGNITGSIEWNLEFYNIGFCGDCALAGCIGCTHTKLAGSCKRGKLCCLVATVLNKFGEFIATLTWFVGMGWCGIGCLLDSCHRANTGYDYLDICRCTFFMF